jgi:hypothetical protein
MNNTSSGIVIQIPDGYLRFGDNTIRIILPDAVSPKELGLSQDTRKLGVAVSSISITG